MRKIIFLVCFFILPLTSYAHKVTVIYTGNSYSSLYPCGHCPASIGGGITRRASAINDIKAKEKNVIIVDAGNFTAGSALDEASINPDMDAMRSIYCYEAMQAMGYDVVGIGEAEFNFGADFLKNNIKKNSLKAVSSNLNFAGVLPYYIKEFSGFKIGIIGLSPQTIYKKTGLNINDYEKALRETVEKIKNKVEFIILVSSAGEEANLVVINKFPEIKLILTSGNITSPSPYEKVKETIIMRPSYLAKELRIANLDVKSKKILGFDFKAEKLALSLNEDSKIKKIIPACFRDGDCPKKEGMVGTCQAPGLNTAACAYFEPNKIEALIITDNACPFCSLVATQKTLKDMFTGINFRVIDYKEKEAQEFIKKYSIASLPAFILPNEIKNEKEFSKITDFFEEKQGKIFAKPELSGLFLFLNRQEIPNKIDFFVNIYDASASGLFNDLVSFCAKEKVSLSIHFILDKANASGYPREELRVAYAVKEKAPDKFIEYVKMRISSIRKASWMDTIEAAGIDYKKIKEVLKSANITKAVEDDNKLSLELNIDSGNVILINNNRIFKVFQIKDTDLEKFFR